MDFVECPLLCHGLSTDIICVQHCRWNMNVCYYICLIAYFFRYGVFSDSNLHTTRITTFQGDVAGTMNRAPGSRQVVPMNCRIHPSPYILLQSWSVCMAKLSAYENQNQLAWQRTVLTNVLVYMEHINAPLWKYREGQFNFESFQGFLPPGGGQLGQRSHDSCQRIGCFRKAFCPLETKRNRTCSFRHWACAATALLNIASFATFIELHDFYTPSAALGLNIQNIHF